MELYAVFSVLDRSRAELMTRLYEDLKLSVTWSSLGEGTATSEHLLLYDLEQNEKAVISTVVSAPTLKKLMSAAKRKLLVDIPGNGVVMALPMKSVMGGKNLAYITDGQTIGGAVPKMDFEYELIIVILNEGYSDLVMDAARSAGATGGTVFHAKGTGGKRSEKFFGVSLADEKDVIYILSHSSKKSAIMKAIDAGCGTQDKIGAICFSVPVSEVAGLRKLDEESSSS